MLSFKTVVVEIVTFLSVVFFIFFGTNLINDAQIKPQTFVQGIVTRTGRQSWAIDGKLSTGKHIKAHLAGDEEPALQKVYINKTAGIHGVYPGYTSKSQLLYARRASTCMMSFSLVVFIGMLRIAYIYKRDVYTNKQTMSTQDKPKTVMDSIKI